jgi:DNA-binding HxlR family transcriptional regulator
MTTSVSGGESAENAQYRQDMADRSAEFAINLIQGKWKTRVLFQLRHGPVRMTQLRKMHPEASKKMLTQQLREMEQDGLIVRKDFSGKLRHVEYSLSHSRGFAALRLINTLATWSREHRPED